MKQIVYDVVRIASLTRQVSRLILRPHVLKDAIDFQAGQYIHVIHPDGDVSPLSVACAPTDGGEIELHLGHAPANKKAQEILTMAEQDRQLRLAGPYGSCTASRFSLTRPLLFFVRGTGFAPAKALIEKLATFENCPPLHLYWGVAAVEDFYLLDLIEAWENQFAFFRFTSLVSEPSDQQQLHHVLLADYPDLSAYQVYACGSQEMVMFALDCFQQHGLMQNQFYSDWVEA